MDHFSIVADEVALEGLDGITIPSLWIRLENRQPKFPLKLDDCTQEFIWKYLISDTELKFYQLPQERDDVELFDRFKDSDHETSADKTQTKEIYPVDIILENKDGIKGSCAVFKQRTDVTKHVRSKSLTPLLSLQEALERYGRKLVVVASQELRFRTLIGNESDPDLKLNDDSYCLLERVGRARWQGELQTDLNARSFKTDFRKLHYIRKSLVKHGLICMQGCCTRQGSGQQQHSILLLLNRFYVHRRSKYDVLMEYVSNLLQHSPNQLTSVVALRELLNVNDLSFKRVLQYMRLAKLIEIFKCPVEDLDPSGGPHVSRKGNKICVRCVKLLKPYTGKSVTVDDDDEDEDEEDDNGARRRTLPVEGRIMEKDVLSQAYSIVLSCGTKGVPQSGIGNRLNVGKLESRMLCRRMETQGVVKGFMEDEGRQRTTKYISHRCVGVSDRLQLFAKEQERQKLLCSSAPPSCGVIPASPQTPSTSESTAKEAAATPAANKIQKAGERGRKDAMSEEINGYREVDAAGKELDGEEGKTSRKSGAKRSTEKRTSSVRSKRTQPETPIAQPTPAECETTTRSKSTTTTPDSVSTPRAEQAQVQEKKESTSSLSSALPQREALKAADNPVGNNIEVVQDVLQPKTPGDKKHSNSLAKSHETYRLLKRKNLIVEAVRSCKIIEGLYPLQKLINEEEKQDGFSSKCCKKTIIRLVHSLSREGLLKIYRTTIIQDGLTKQVEMIVHPSIQPNDDVVNRVIEEIRFRLSSSYTAVRLQQAEEKAKRQQQASAMKDKEFKPIRVKGLGKSFGFQPKMHRLRAVHNFLWYLIYGHQCHQIPNSTDPDAKHPDRHEKQDLKGTQNSTNTNEQTEPSESAAVDSVDPQTVNSSPSNLDVTPSCDEDDEPEDKSASGDSESDLKVYVEEESWKRFLPPVPVHKEYGSGWAKVGDLLLCLPLSVFIQIVQINYEVDGLEEYLSDPLKQHYLVRKLPARMKRQLLYKRKYVFTFHENLQKLAYMGLLQFGPVEKFKEKDQGFLYLKRKATIVDTTNAEPHYWLVAESPDKPFERRQYTFKTAEDVENYWFDLMCVCLNTPLGVIRSKRNATEDDDAPSFVHERYVFAGLAYLLKGSSEVCDDGSIPGDGKGAGGLDSEFFSHLKRNWFWTNHLLATGRTLKVLEVKEQTVRLKSLLSKNALRIALEAGGTTQPRFVTSKRPLIAGNIEVAIEPASRNQEVVGGKRRKRKRNKKEVVKVPRKKKKEPKKRTPAHDAADHQALKMMTRQRVTWSVQEDSLMMLCSVASHLLNSKLKRPFIPHCVVRDLLHAEFVVSIDKTSIAVARRSRYILRNPQTLLNYRICLAEVYQDKPLMKVLEENKPANPHNPEDCSKVFCEYIRLLRQKFSSALIPSDMIMPDTKDQLFSRFRVSAIDVERQMSCRDTLSCTDDIHTIVLHNLIQSTLVMNNSQMKSSRSFQTFYIYSKYNQELLCRVFLQCRKRGLVNRRRVNQPFGPKKKRSLPILPMSYQLSQSYYRTFSWRFPYSLCTDSFHFLKSLLNNKTGEDRPVTAFYHETADRTENKEEVTEKGRGSERRKKQSEGKEDDRPASEPVAQQEKTNGDSTQEGENDQRKVEGEEERRTEQKNLEDCFTAESGEDSEQRDDNLPTPAASNTDPHASQEPPDVSDMLRFSLDAPGGACVVSLSLMSLGLLSVYMSIPKQIVVVDSTMVENDVVKSMAALEEEDEENGEESEGRKRLEVKAHQASHTNYLIMRGYCAPGIVKIRNLNTNDNIVVESCLMRLQLRNTPAHHMFTVENFSLLDLMKSGPSLLPSRLTYSTVARCSTPSSVEECDRRLIEQRGYSPQDIGACAQLRRSLDAAGENGLDIHDLYETHIDLEEPQPGCTRSLQQYMKELQEEGQVLQVGSLGARWVLMQHAEPWLLTVKPMTQPGLTYDRLSALKKQHNITFMLKRCRKRTTQEPEEPPAKKSALDTQEDEDAERLSSGISRENSNEDDQLKRQEERTDERCGDSNLKFEEDGGKRMQLEEGEEEEDTEGRQENKKEPRAKEDDVLNERDEEVCSPPAGPNDDDDENVSFISRPWRMVDGSLNRPVCKGMLEAMLYHIMYQPGLTQQTLVDHYKNVLQPVAVLDLVQALIEIGCVTKKTLVKRPKPRLFGCSVHQTRSETKVKTEEPDEVFYEPTISCCLRLAQMLPNERHWNYCLP